MEKTAERLYYFSSEFDIREEAIRRAQYYSDMNCLKNKIAENEKELEENKKELEENKKELVKKDKELEELRKKIKELEG